MWIHFSLVAGFSTNNTALRETLTLDNYLGSEPSMPSLCAMARDLKPCGRIGHGTKLYICQSLTFESDKLFVSV